MKIESSHERLRLALIETECWCQPTRDHVEGLYGSEPFFCGRCIAIGETRPIVPEDRNCPTCGNGLAYDDGLYYCHMDGALGEDRCPDALKRWRGES